MSGEKRDSRIQFAGQSSQCGSSASGHNNESNGFNEAPKFEWTGTSLQWVDYVLIYNKNDDNQWKNEYREKFIEQLKNKKLGGSAAGIEIEEYEFTDGSDELCAVKIFVPFGILAREAEKLKLEMPLDKSMSELEGFDLAQKIGLCCHLIEDDEDDYISGPFSLRKLHLFKGHENKDTFFRPALRSYLTYNILINTCVGGPKSRIGVEAAGTLSSDKDLSKIALPKLIHMGVFLVAFPLHEPSNEDPYLEILKKDWLQRYPDGELRFDESVASEEQIRNKKKLEGVSQINNCHFNFRFATDERQQLDRVWTRIFKYQPLDRVRNYFGEKIAFYFAWSGHMITMLWAPTILGFGIFVYGLVLSIQRHTSGVATTPIPSNATDIERVVALVDNMLATVKEAFDNLLTPIFAVIICIWGTVHTELWKRYRSTLAYEWDVNNYEHSEPDRPEFEGTKERTDPVSGKIDTYYPGGKQAMKFLTSFIVLLVMICVVFIGVAAVIVYRVFVTIRICPNTSGTNCLILNTVVSSLLNAVFIIAVGKLYDKIAQILTDWENHRTQSAYNNALIIKLFAFQFANSYSSLFYIAFFRGQNLFMPVNGVFNLGKEFIDTCGTDGNCMSMLSFQVLILMIAKPMPKLITDHLIPLITRLYRRCRKRCNRSQIESGDAQPATPNDINKYIVNEYQKFDLGDFTIDEYMEKIIQFGYLMLFAASFPLAPLIALLTNLFDVSTDAQRMLWIFRRPVAKMAQDIGMWHDIVEFLNVAGVISNACLIAFTASWVKQPEFNGVLNNITAKLLIIIIVENGVLGLKYFISAVIPDVPSLVQLQIRRERYRVPRILSTENPNAISDGEGSNIGSMTSIRSKSPRNDDDAPDAQSAEDTTAKKKKRRKKKKSRKHESRSKHESAEGQQQQVEGRGDNDEEDNNRLLMNDRSEEEEEEEGNDGAMFGDSDTRRRHKPSSGNRLASLPQRPPKQQLQQQQQQKFELPTIAEQQLLQHQQQQQLDRQNAFGMQPLARHDTQDIQNV